MRYSAAFFSFLLATASSVSADDNDELMAVKRDGFSVTTLVNANHAAPASASVNTAPTSASVAAAPTSAIISEAPASVDLDEATPSVNLDEAMPSVDLDQATPSVDLNAASTTVVATSSSGAKTKTGDHHHPKATQNPDSAAAECHELSMLMALMEVANNQTKLEKASNNNATRASEIQASATSAAPVLQSLQANSTLTAECSVQAEGMACDKMHKLERLEKLAANQTELAKVTNNNATRAAEIQAQASMRAPVLAMLQANTTLTQYCAMRKTQAQCHALLVKLPDEIALSNNQTALEAMFNGNATKISEFEAKASKDAQLLAKLQGNATLTSICASVNGSGTASPTSTSVASAASSLAATSTLGSTAKAGAAGVQPSLGGMLALVALFFGGVVLL